MSEIFCRRLRLYHTSGDLLFPVKMKDRDTGRAAFRLSKEGNKKTDSIEVTDEQEMIRKVTTEGYAVRARTEKPGGRQGLFKIDQRGILRWELVEKSETAA